MRRRNISAEEKEERIQVSLKLPKSILDQIDKSWKSGSNYTGRSHYIEEACKYYLDCVPCPNCGTLNKSTAHICSECEFKLQPYQQILSLIESEVHNYDQIHNHILSLKEEFDDLAGKINWHLNKLEPEKKSVISDVLSLYIHSISLKMDVVNTYLKYYDAYSQDSSVSPRDFLSEKFPDFDVAQIIQTYIDTGDLDYSLSNKINDMHDDITYSLLNFYYHSAKQILSNPEKPNRYFQTYSQLSTLRHSLWDRKMSLINVEKLISSCIIELKNVDKTIDLLNQKLTL